MSNKHVFDCGCSIDIIDGHPQINYTKLNEDCPKAWEIYKKGNTQSIFQLESYLGKKWSKELKPSNIEEAAMLISIIRPGTLQSLNSSGVSLTKVFCDRKRDGWKDEEHFSILDVLLLDTFGINIYQETSMLIAKEIAGFDGSQSMKLIKSIGKKDAELLFSLRKEFLDGCAKVGKVLENEANAIFDNIEASARYAFNKAHACGYAKAGYWTAWVKAHLPKHHVCAWLRNAKSEQKPLEEIRAVISESRRLQINVMPPSINNLPSTNFFVKNDNVYFGLDSIKGCGEKGLAKLIEADINYADCSWTEFLILYSHLVNKTQMINMIRTGCFDYTTIPRIRLEHEYNQYNLLTKSEKSKCLDIFNTDSDYELSTIIGKFIPFCTAKRLPTIKAIYDSIIEKSNIKDDKLNIINHERELLGINVTCTHISRAEIPDVKDSCAAVSKKKADTELLLVGEISDFMEIKIKNPNSKLVGKSMGSFTLTDDRGHTEAIIFPKELEFYQGALYDGNIIMVKCKKSKRDGIIIDKIYEV